ncbi:N-acetylmuramoyl-L-alanine amidase [Streptomyces sp. NPDC058373]|uniref:N-acetylmuramoyl-L-alanine amidase n=1 Tax=Streptomyces sp. NPDC058373 TaxID=3346465 RepID=UPI00364B8EA9
MAQPMTAATFLAALKSEGVTVVEVGSWRTHNRNSKGAWGPVNGVMIHHTVTSGSARTVDICRNGYAGLPGPLCHGVITKDGRVHLVGYGRANHAGSGDDDVLAAVIAEKKLPSANEANTDGNARFYGFECENLGDGKDPWPAAQLDAIERVSAAICRVHGWAPESVIGHLEWQPGKIDPRGFTMASMRDRIKKRLASPAGKTPTPTPKEPTLADMTAAQIHAAVWGRDAIPSPSTVSTHKTNPTWKAESYLPELVDRISRLTAKVDALAKDVAELKKKG